MLFGDYNVCLILQSSYDIIGERDVGGGKLDAPSLGWGRVIRGDVLVIIGVALVALVSSRLERTCLCSWLGNSK